MPGGFSCITEHVGRLLRRDLRPETGEEYVSRGVADPLYCVNMGRQCQELSTCWRYNSHHFETIQGPQQLSYGRSCFRIEHHDYMNTRWSLGSCSDFVLFSGTRVRRSTLHGDYCLAVANLDDGFFFWQGRTGW